MTLARFRPAWRTDLARFEPAWQEAAPAITLISDQDSMNIDASSLVIENAATDTPTIKVTIRLTGGEAVHWYFGLTGMIGKRPIIEVDITGIRDGAYHSSWRPKVSQDDHATWVALDSFTALSTPARVQFQPTVALTADTVYFADCQPYRVTDFASLAATLAADTSGLVSPSAEGNAGGVIGTSPAEVDENGRAIGEHDIYGFVLGDDGATTDGNPKRWMVVDAGIHSGEVLDGWPLEGLIDFYLNGTGALADRLRSNWKIGVYFALTPNGRFGGHWRTNFRTSSDPNRDWSSFNLAESVIVRDAMLADLGAATEEIGVSMHTSRLQDTPIAFWYSGAVADQSYQTAWMDAIDAADSSTWTRTQSTISTAVSGWHVSRGAKIAGALEFDPKYTATTDRYKQTGQRLLEATAQIDADGVFYPAIGSGAIDDVSLSAPTGSSVGNAVASGALPEITLGEVTASGSGDAITSGNVDDVSLTTPTGTSTGDSNASGNVDEVSLAAPVATGVGTATSSGAVDEVTTTSPTGSAIAQTVVIDVASGAIAETSLGEVTATAVGSANIDSDIDPVSLSAPTGTAAGVVNATASGNLSEVTLSEVNGTAGNVENGVASGAVQEVTLTAVTGGASGTTNVIASGKIQSVTISAPQAQASSSVNMQVTISPVTLTPPNGRVILFKLGIVKNPSSISISRKLSNLSGTEILTSLRNSKVHSTSRN